MEEVAFPRGSSKPNADGTGGRKKHDEDDLFRLGEAFKKKRKSKSSTHDESTIKKAKIEGSGFYVDTDADVVEPISAKVFNQGMLILGCVMRIKKYEMMISLPNSLMATVSVTDISDAYTDQLKRFAESESISGEKTQQPERLRNMFAVGSYVVGKVKEITPLKNDKARIAVTLNPREVHEGVTPFVLYHNMVLTAAVVSAEDHGYVMDVGIRGLAAFLKREKASERIAKKGQQLAIGQLLMCVINMPNIDFTATTPRSLCLDATPKAVAEAVPKKVNQRILLPGTRIAGVVNKTTKQGVILSISEHKGLVMKQHLIHPFQTLEMLKPRQEVNGRVLCVHPVTKGVYVTLQKRVLKLFKKAQFDGLRYGDIVEEAEVVGVVKGSVLFRLAKDVKGIAPPSRLPVKKEVEEKFPLGSVHRCMVRRLKPMDDVVMVTLKPEDLSNIVLHIDDLKPGDMIPCAVKDHQSHGIGVVIRGGIRGFIPCQYLSDQPMANRQKTLKPGTSLNCRALKVVKEKNLVILANRASLVNSDLPIIASYEDAEPGMIVEGLVHAIFDKFFLVSFYNDVKGFVSISEVEGIVSLSATFKPGQKVRCRVLASYPTRQRLQLTMMKLEQSIEGLLQEDRGEFPVGEFVSFHVTAVHPDGLDGAILPSCIRAVLPVYHLSDHMTNCPARLQMYTPGDIIEKVLCFSDAAMPIVTLKQVFFDWVEKGEAVSSLDSLKLGMLVPLVVKNLAGSLVFVTLLYGMTAVIHIKNLSVLFTSDIKNCGLKRQQSLVGEVVKVEEGKAEFSIVPVNSLAATKEGRLALFTSFLTEQERIRQHFLLHGTGTLRTLASQIVGSIIDFTPKTVNEYGAVGEIAGGVKALVTKEHMWADQLVVGQTVPALVLALDFEECCIELLTDAMVVNDVQSSMARIPYVTFQPEQAYFGVIVMVKEDYMLGYMKSKGVKRLVYLPNKRHLNHVPNLSILPKYGEECLIMLETISNTVCVGMLSTDVLANQKLSGKKGLGMQNAIKHVPVSKRKMGKKGKNRKVVGKDNRRSQTKKLKVKKNRHSETAKDAEKPVKKGKKIVRTKILKNKKEGTGEVGENVTAAKKPLGKRQKKLGSKLLKDKKKGKFTSNREVSKNVTDAEKPLEKRKKILGSKKLNGKKKGESTSNGKVSENVKNAKQPPAFRFNFDCHN